MAYQDCLTGHWFGNFRYLTKKQAGCIYAAYKRGEVKMTRRQINHMYDVVEDTEAEGECEFYSQVLSFIFDRRFDLAQAMLDGRNVHIVYEETTKDILMTQDVFDHPENYGLLLDLGHHFCEVGDTYQMVVSTTEKWVVD